jgi:hypothetical protein
MATVEALPLGNPQVFRPRSALGRAAAYFRRVDAALGALIDRRRVNLNTLNRFGKLWLRNLLANAAEFAQAPGVGQLSDRFDGIPALVLAAGPSLDEVLPLLVPLRQRLLLIAVDTSHRLCREAGGNADLLVTVDPQYWNARHLDRAELADTVVVSESSAHPRIFRQLNQASAALYFISSFFPLGRLLEEAVGSKGIVGAGGSVATTAWDLARLVGCRTVYMAGLDLGYPGGRTHCRGAYFEERAHQESSRLVPIETGRFRSLREAGPTWVENNSGGRTLTDRRLLIYKWWFENQMSQAKQGQGCAAGTTTFSLAREGVFISGMPFREPEELLRLPVIRSRVDDRTAEIRREARGYAAKEGAERRQAASAALMGLARDLEQLTSYTAKARSICARLRQLAREGSPPNSESSTLYRELDRFDGAILELSSRNVVGFLFQSLIQRILDSPESRRSADEILEISEELYGEMTRSAEYHLGLITAAVGRVRFS